MILILNVNLNLFLNFILKLYMVFSFYSSLSFFWKLSSFLKAHVNLQPAFPSSDFSASLFEQAFLFQIWSRSENYDFRSEKQNFNFFFMIWYCSCGTLYTTFGLRTSGLVIPRFRLRISAVWFAYFSSSIIPTFHYYRHTFTRASNQRSIEKFFN